jgi:hypothetical protein
VSRVRNRYPRIPCVVPHCRCGATCYPPGFEIICPKHYRLVDRSLKALRRRARRAGKHRLDQLLWRRIKRQAIERATGISA